MESRYSGNLFGPLLGPGRSRPYFANDRRVVSEERGYATPEPLPCPARIWSNNQVTDDNSWGNQTQSNNEGKVRAFTSLRSQIS